MRVRRGLRLANIGCSGFVIEAILMQIRCEREFPRLDLGFLNSF